MKKIRVLLYSLLAVLMLVSCDENGYLEDLYVAPKAAFEIEKDTYDVFESVHFVNKGSGQYYVVYPGDANHVYGKEGDTGFAAASMVRFLILIKSRELLMLYGSLLRLMKMESGNFRLTR